MQRRIRADTEREQISRGFVSTMSFTTIFSSFRQAVQLIETRGGDFKIADFSTQVFYDIRARITTDNLSIHSPVLCFVLYACYFAKYLLTS